MVKRWFKIRSMYELWVWLVYLCYRTAEGMKEYGSGVGNAARSVCRQDYFSPAHVPMMFLHWVYVEEQLETL